MRHHSSLGVVLLLGLLMPLSSCISSPSLTSITVTPTTMNFGGAGLNAQLTAMGSYTRPGHPATLEDITDQVTWASSATQCVTVSSTGLITSGGNTCTNILVTASEQGFPGLISGSMTVNVTNGSSDNSGEPLASVAIIPASQTLTGVGQTADFVAIGTTGTGTTVNLNTAGTNYSAAVWKSSNPAVATIDPASGIATVPANAVNGATTITAIATNLPDGSVVTGTGTLTVNISAAPEPLVSLTVTPASQTLAAVGQTAILTALGTTGTGTSVNLTDKTAAIGNVTIQPAVWSSSNPAVATVDQTTGVVTITGGGVTAITAIAANPDNTVVIGTATITSTATATSGTGGMIASIAVIPGSQTVASPTQTAQFFAIGTTTTGATTDLTNQVSWSSSSSQIAQIGSDTGFATAEGKGTATITALYTPPGGGNVVTGTAQFIVSGGTSELFATPMTIIPNSQSMSASGQTAQLIALATSGSTGLQEDVTDSPQITWSSDTPNIASVSATGLVTGHNVGTTTITAELTNPDKSVVSASSTVVTSLTTPPEPLLSLTIIPSAITVNQLQDTGQFLAIGTFSSIPYVRDLTDSVTWTSSWPSVFPVDTNSGGNAGASAGIVTAFGSGTGITIIAEATSGDGTIQTATAEFNCPLALPNPNGNPPTPGSCFDGSQAFALLSTLTVYNEGLNASNWEVTAPSATGTADVLHCGPGWSLPVAQGGAGGAGGSVCVATYPIGATILLTAPKTGAKFGGWSYNCTPSDANGNPLPGPVFWTENGPNYCTVTFSPAVYDNTTTPPTLIQPANTDVTVGAIFND